MSDRPNILALLEAGKHDEAVALLSQPITIAAVTGPRSAKAALAAAELLFEGDVEHTARWMTAPSRYLQMTPLECAEQSDQGLKLVIKMINQLFHGSYL